MDYDAETDLTALEAMTANLKSYLHGKELYGMISHNLPRMTVGGLLLRLHRLNAAENLLMPEQQSRLDTARDQCEELSTFWRVHYEEKVLREIKARLRNLNNFADESEGRARQNPVELDRRTIVEHLRDEAERIGCWSPELAGEVRVTDHRLRAVFGSGKGAFAWADELKPHYPANRYWWLYS